MDYRDMLSIASIMGAVMFAECLSIMKTFELPISPVSQIVPISLFLSGMLIRITE